MRKVTIEKRQFGDDDLAASIAAWQLQGPAAIWKAMREINVLTYALRGEDISSKRMDRQSFKKLPVPWLNSEVDPGQSEE